MPDQLPYPVRGSHNWDDDLQVYIDDPNRVENVVDAVLPDKIADPDDPIGAALNAASAEVARREHRRQFPRERSLFLYEHSALQDTRPLWHDGQTLYVANLVTAPSRRLYKSTDGGKTYVERGTIPTEPKAMVRLASGTLIMVSTGAVIYRSTDDGATWVTGPTLGFSPLTGQGIVETPSGKVLIAEYGNTGSTVYRIMRSTDDGVTWSACLSSSGTDPAYDPGHFHCVVWDKYEGCLLAYQDRPTGHIWRSNDEGATWTKISDVSEQTHPNFVSPMIFPDYIAWGYDNELGGVIARLPRDDFYAGRWDDVEITAEMNNKVYYGSFPLTDEVWIASGALETIGGADAPTTGVPTGHFTIEAVLVSDQGATVTSALEWDHEDITPGVAFGTRLHFPSYRYNVYDHRGLSIMALPVGSAGYQQVTVPYSAGVTPTNAYRPAGRFRMNLPWSGLRWKSRLNGLWRQLIEVTNADVVRIKHDGVDTVANPTAKVPEVRLFPDGSGALVHDGNRLLVWGPNGALQLRGTPLELGLPSSSPSIHHVASGSPNGVITARQGSLCLSGTGGAEAAQVYLKVIGSDANGWEPLGRRVRGYTSAFLLSKMHEVNVTDKYAGKQVWDSTLSRPLWAKGASDISPWIDATGATVHTPA